jgi:hypothetical protein
MPQTGLGIRKIYLAAAHRRLRHGHDSGLVQGGLGEEGSCRLTAVTANIRRVVELARPTSGGA